MALATLELGFSGYSRQRGGKPGVVTTCAVPRLSRDNESVHKFYARALVI